MWLEITNCEVDGIGTSWQHIDGMRELQLREQTSSAHQHEALRAKFGSLNRTINKCDLYIRFPSEVKVTIQDRDADRVARDVFMNGANENGHEDELEATTPAVMHTPSNHASGAVKVTADALQYKPITVKIWFRLSRPEFGLRFLGPETGHRYPHLYTSNHPVPCSAGMWLPCLDGIWERSTWELSVVVPKTLGDINRRSKQTKASHNGISSGFSDYRADEDDVSNLLEMTVVCSADRVAEKTLESDKSRKVVSFAQSSPVGASHIGFAVAPFEQCNLTDFRDTEEDEMLGSSAVEILGYCLPGKSHELKNACHPLYKAMDFFVKEYGSYPFTNYQVCFVEDLEVDTIALAGMALCSDRLLYPERVIDLLYPVTRCLVRDLASQWIGINIVPRSWSDTWLILGLALYITGLFLKRLMGNNDYRYRLKQSIHEITQLDINRPPISSRDLEIPIDPEQTRFIALKAPVVLHMLDQRLTKAGTNLGLRRIIPKLFLQALSGELANGILSTDKFIRQCEKVAHVKLEEFVRQWITGHGYPIFAIVQRYNKKKMMIEMGIRQQQFQDTPSAPLLADSFIDDAYRHQNKPPVGLVDAIFTGPITIRIHEADGTPYEHVVDLKDQYHKFDIPYNNKYKKRVRGRRQPKTRVDGDQHNDELDEEPPDGDLVNYFGDGFQSEQDQITWHLQDWSKEDEDRMSGEAFEWIRIDSGFEWICVMQVGQPDYMFHSQLQQDRDVVAQYEAIQYFATSPPTGILSSILFRTIMDDRYFYGIRQLAATVLARCAINELNMIGQTHLIAIFRHFYCYPDKSRTIPKSNDFSDIPNYFLRCSIVESLVKVRDRGITTDAVRRLFIEQLRHNDNSANHYDDTHYIARIINSITSSVIPSDTTATEHSRVSTILKDLKHMIVEIERFQRMDRWRPSYQNLITRTVIQGKEALMVRGLLPVVFREYMEYSQEHHHYLVREQAYASMLRLGGLRAVPLQRYILYSLQKDPSSYMRQRLSLLIKHAFGNMALESRIPEADLVPDMDAMIVEEDTSLAVERRKDRELRTTLDGALGALQDEFENNESLKTYLWTAANDWHLAPLARRNLLDICNILYETKESRVLRFKMLSMKARLRCMKEGPGKVVIKKIRPLEKYQKKAPTKPVKIKLKLTHNTQMAA